ncbi:hypothetical protein EJ774_21265 [Pandoraea apista]|uniref:Uncharacterized protein n=1 Tax=Pandoraea apista TaxID=93218 RepID=A0ABX9ZLG0_9BURK|nr:hypothetical protein [Pandoraea apista]RSK77886.1 hypothetical protein EJE83_18030 [Pandoraea apista]RUN81873.1 hypothetical protein EJ774_21265 [Pandoraea apista]
MYSDDEIEIAQKNAQIEDQNLRASFAAGDLAFSQSHNATLEEEIEDLKREVDRLNTLLGSPLHVIADKHQKFRASYMQQQETMANWMVSQQAFKNLAYQLADELGLSDEEVAAKLSNNRSRDIEQAAQKYREVARVKDSIK